MLEQETDTILASLRSQTIGGQDSMSLRDLLDLDIPRGIKAYVRADVYTSLMGELFSSSRFQRIEKNTPGLLTLARAFITSMADGYAFPREEFMVILENAVHFLENYLCRPQWTLTNFVFEAREKVDITELRSKLDYTADYAYFRTLSEQVMKQRGHTEITAEDFRALIASVDEEVVRQHNPRELALLAKPIFDFLLLRDSPPDVPVPLKPILLFFDDKKMKILRDYIESICRIRQRTGITLDELTAMIEDLSLGQPTPPSPSVPAFAPSTETPEVLEPPPPGREEPQHDERPPEEPSYEEERPVTVLRDESPSLFDSVTEDADGRDDGPSYTDLFEDEGSSETPPETAGAGEGTSNNIPLSLTFSGMQDSQNLNNDTSLPDLNDLIPSHLRARFIKRIFDRDELQYRDVIEALNNTDTWRDAALLLNKLYRTNNIDPFDADIVSFTDAIYRRFKESDRDES
jgi:hypothetical protein